MTERESLDELEAKALEELSQPLEGYLDLAIKAANLISAVFSISINRDDYVAPQSHKVALNCMSKLTNDLRCTVLLALRGYPIQALSMASSLFETACVILQIGNDDASAQQWIDHDDPKKTPADVYSMLERGYKRLNELGCTMDVKKEVGETYKVYRQLCWAKHGNPILQKDFGQEQQGNKVTFKSGPDASDRSVRCLSYALEHSIKSILKVIISFNNDFVPDARQEEIDMKLLVLSRMAGSLRDEAIKKWGNKDPFEGRW